MREKPDIDLVTIEGNRLISMAAFGKKVFLISTLFCVIFLLSCLIALPTLMAKFLIALLVCAVWFGMYTFYKKMKKRFQSRVEIARSLRFLIASNGLYSEYDSAYLGFRLGKDKITIFGIKRGDGWTEKVSNLETQLSALLGLPLLEKSERPSSCAYSFLLRKDERINLNSAINSMNMNGSDEIRISGNISYQLHNVPHSLIVGGTGSGKSYFILGKIVSYLSLTPKADLRIIDPKKADLSLLRFVDGFENKVATEANQICRILRETVELMEQRYATYFNDISAWGKTYRDFNLPVVICVFDEFAAFMHSVDKKTAKEALDYVFTIVMKGRQAGVMMEILMQRPSADDLPTNIRSQMGFRAGLGNMDSIGYNMIFDTNNVDYKAVTEKGGGYIQIDGVHTSPVYFETPIIEKGYDFIGEIKRLMGNGEKQTVNDSE